MASQGRRPSPAVASAVAGWGGVARSPLGLVTRLLLVAVLMAAPMALGAGAGAMPARPGATDVPLAVPDDGDPGAPALMSHPSSCRAESAPVDDERGPPHPGCRPGADPARRQAAGTAVGPQRPPVSAALVAGARTPTGP
ncbi:MAG: hypothetical protein ACK4QW_18055, partial [Alphaproteobacteria bacterium]